MPLEILLLLCLGGLTMIAYMIAINAHGPVRLSFSYLIATIMLAATVYAVVQHVNTKISTLQQAQVAKLTAEKNQAQQEVVAKAETLQVNQQKLQAAARVSAYIAEGMALAGTISGADLRDMNLDFDALLARANDASVKAARFKQRIVAIDTDLVVFPECAVQVRQAADQLAAAGSFFRLYYHAEDSDQEAERGRQMQANVRSAATLFRDASAKLTTLGR